MAGTSTGPRGPNARSYLGDHRQDHRALVGEAVDVAAEHLRSGKGEEIERDQQRPLDPSQGLRRQHTTPVEQARLREGTDLLAEPDGISRQTAVGRIEDNL